MCGIFGYISKEDVSNEREYFNNIKHRGPDSSSLYKYVFGDYKIVLGFHRLAIIDLDNGQQPFVYKDVTSDTTLYLLCNGEIYNYKSLIEKYDLKTNSDCRVILEMYLKNKTMTDIIEELDGEFAFVFIAVVKDTINVYYGRDRFGIRPLFYRFDDSGLYFASELKGIPGGNAIQVKPRRVYHNNLVEESVFTYYYIGKGEKLIDSNEYYNKIRNTLTKSVRDRMQSERPIGALLSGGLDSSLICGIAARLLREKDQKLATFSIGMDYDSPDIINARKVAKHINSNHFEIIIPVEEWIDNLRNVIRQIETYDITTIRASCGQYLISKWISQNTDIKVILNGDGSDEVTSGYLYFYNAPTAEMSHLENMILLDQIHNYDVLRVDRGISAWGLESRVPFLAHTFVDTYLSFDKNERNAIPNERMEKFMLREAFKNEDIIPEEVLWRKKEAFSDGCSSTRKSWYEHIQDYINTQMTDEEYNRINTANFLRFPSKEACWYYKIYKEYYPSSTLNVEYWMPKWCGEHKGDPSARKLKVYNNL